MLRLAAAALGSAAAGRWAHCLAFEEDRTAERRGTLPFGRVRAVSTAVYNANKPLEDRHAVVALPGDEQAFLGVFDGHGGWQVADFAKTRLAAFAREEMTAAPDRESAPQMAAALTRAFHRVDREFLRQVKPAFDVGFGAVARVGACALLAVVGADSVVVANAGDVRAVLGHRTRSGALGAVALSNDHNARVPSEQKALAGEHPLEDNIVLCKHESACYVKGRLQPTRSLGDAYLKQSEFNGPPYVNGDNSRGRHVPHPYTPPYISATPEVIAHQLSEQDEVLVIASDGLWDFLSNEEVVQIVADAAAAGNEAGAADALVEASLVAAAEACGMTVEELMALPAGRQRRSRHDDVTVVVAFL